MWIGRNRVRWRRVEWRVHPRATARRGSGGRRRDRWTGRLGWSPRRIGRRSAAGPLLTGRRSVGFPWTDGARPVTPRTIAATVSAAGEVLQPFRVVVLCRTAATVTGRLLLFPAVAVTAAGGPFIGSIVAHPRPS